MNFSEIIGFDWDEGNREKNWVKHKVAVYECEQIFFNDPLFVFEDTKHSESEQRHYALGQTNNERLLFISFTIRNNLIRIISTRPMSKNEKKLYEKHSQENS